MIGDCEGRRCAKRIDVPAALRFRFVVGIEGCVKMRSELVTRFDYGRAVPWISRLENGVLRAIAGPPAVQPSPPGRHVPGMQLQACRCLPDAGA
jgi:hypothetical protein